VLLWIYQVEAEPLFVFFVRGDSFVFFVHRQRAVFLALGNARQQQGQRQNQDRPTTLSELRFTSETLYVPNGPAASGFKAESETKITAVAPRWRQRRLGST
jgi:hypothetical protein